MRPLEQTLTGFKGIRSGLGRKTLTLDFRTYRGLIAIVGDNGRGKSTVLSNMHPYRIMPDRVKKYAPKAFSFYEECYGSDASKEFIFEMEGSTYRSIVRIDVPRRKQEAYLYRLDASEWVPYGNTNDGKLDVYDAAVEALCGSPRIFFTSVFRSQKAPALSSYTRGDMMDIFSELINVEENKERQETAGDIAAALLSKRSQLQTERDKYEQTVKEAAKKASEKVAAEKRLLTIADDIGKLEFRRQATLGTVTGLQVMASLQQETAKKREKLTSDIANKGRSVADLQKTVEEKRAYYNAKHKEKKTVQAAVQESIKRAPTLREKAGKEAAKKEEAESLKKSIRLADERFSVLNRQVKEYGPIETRIKEVESSLKQARLGRSHRIKTARKDLREARKAVERLKQMPCANLDVARQCVFVKDAASSRDALGSLEEVLRAARVPDPAEKTLPEELTRLNQKVAGKIEIERQEKEAKEHKDNLIKQLEQLEKELASIGETAKELAKLEEAEKTLPQLAKDIADILSEGKEAITSLQKQIDAFNAEITALTAEMGRTSSAGESLPAEIACLTGFAQEDAEEVTALRNEEAALRVTIGTLVEGIKQSEAASVEIVKLNGEIEALSKDISEWQLLEAAMEGITTLEIDDAGPAVTAITNDILLSCYGPRFSVKIKTQDEKAKGGDMKEVFDIIVFDAEHIDAEPEGKSLSVTSGGEETWLDDSITRGISLFNASREGKRYETLFSDEKDGRLTEANRKKFMAVKRKVMELGDFACEFFISHTTEIQEMADAIIDLNALVVEGEANASPAETSEEHQDTLV